MPEKARLTNRVVDRLERGQIVWDSELAGFGVRCQVADKVYLLKTRVGGRQKWLTIGKHGAPWTPQMARKQALTLLGDVAQGKDPSARRIKQEGVTVAALAEAFLAQHVGPRRKPRTAELYRDLIKRIIVPSLGRRQATDIKSADVERLHHSLREGPYQANRVLAVLSVMFSFAERHGHVPDGSNPCRRVEKFRESARERFLTDDEIARLGEALAAEDSAGLPAYEIAALRLLLLTGARLSEILELRWEYVDLQRSCLFLPDSKTGRKTIVLNPAALQVLSEVPRVEGNPWVIVGKKPGSHLVNLQKPWRLVRAKAGLDDVRIHDLRHTFASVAAAEGASLHVIGKLLGHANPATTQRYAHLAMDPLRAAGDRVSNAISAALAGKR